MTRGDDSVSADGVDFETTLPVDAIANMAQRAAAQSTGDVEHGRQRVVADHSTDRAMEFHITDWAVAYKKLMVFTVSLTQQNGHVFGSTVIDWHLAEKSAHRRRGRGRTAPVARHTYLQFAEHLVGQVRAADSAARVTVRGDWLLPASLPAPAAPAPAAPAASRASTAPTTPAPLFGAEAYAAAFPPPHTSKSAAVFSPPAPAPSPTPPARPAAAPQPPAWPLPHASTAAAGLITGIPQAADTPSPRVPASPSLHPSPPHTPQHSDPSGRPVAAWSLALPDGRTVTITTAAVLGRAPVPPAEAPGALAVAADDPNRSVSKTHALLALRDGMLWVTDLHSTNGTVVTARAGQVTVCEPDVPVQVDEGSTVSLGEFTLTVVHTQPG